jgi:hypothetical protein
MKPTPLANRTWTYGRAFFLTLGIGITGLMAVVWLAQGHKSDEWPTSAWAFFVGMILAGMLFFCFAVVSSNKAIKRWFDSAGTHEGEGIVAILAAPVYWLGKLLQKRGRKR